MAEHPKFVVRDGLVLVPGSKEWHWWRANRHAIEGTNPQAIDPTHPHAPTSHPLPKGHRHVRPLASSALEHHIVYYANLGLKFAGEMTYSEGADREELFSRSRGAYLHAHADCSQYGATDLKWCGNKLVTCTDYTGTLLEKAKIVSRPAHGRGVIWGPGTGAHFAWLTEHIAGGNDWYCVGFGRQGAPDRNTLHGMNAYFASIGEPGVRYLDFAA